ncbi:hypothetical protein [Paenibacillus rigui]|uniref:hypothetical protein n=1 Tax=Paenibacillus rigui TaxID=554312 RepID=UPI0015C5B4B8|nr:hypothetical protein [Paenibacillus rigui]
MAFETLLCYCAAFGFSEATEKVTAARTDHSSIAVVRGFSQFHPAYCGQHPGTKANVYASTERFRPPRQLIIGPGFNQGLFYIILCFVYRLGFLFTGIQISLLKAGDDTSLLSFHSISGPSTCS